MPKYIQGGDLVVPPGKVFALGDNRTESLDGRYWGFVPRENIVGRPLFVYWSFQTPANQIDKQSLAIASRSWVMFCSTSSIRLGGAAPSTAFSSARHLPCAASAARRSRAMQQGPIRQVFPETLQARSSEPTSIARPLRAVAAVLSLCSLLLLAILPPLISLNRYQHRVTTSMSQVLGRPVHLDRVTLNLLPLPSFTLENFVIDEAPAFGAEPIIRANHGARTAADRLALAASRRVLPDHLHRPEREPGSPARGQWNLAGILLQAAHVEAAPQRRAEPERRRASRISKQPAPAST